MKELKNVKFNNQTRPNFTFDMLEWEELLARDIHDEILNLHKLTFYEILIITQGEGTHTIDFQDYEIQKGTLLTIRKDQVQKFFYNKNIKGFLLLFTEDFLISQFSKEEVAKSFQLFNELLTSPKITVAEPVFNEFLTLIHFIKAEYFSHGDDFSKSIIRSALHMILTKLYRLKAKKGPILLKKKYLEQFLAFQKLVEEKCFETKKVLDYAQLMACTSKTLNNVCRSIVDKSAKVVIDEIVITQLKRLLLNTPLSITEIAYQAGFYEPTNMYKYFKKFTNNSPEGFRQAHT